MQHYATVHLFASYTLIILLAKYYITLGVVCKWNNFVTSDAQIRRPIGTVFELFLPIVAVLFIVVLR